jgi:predicted O-methyltransferase YrrM
LTTLCRLLNPKTVWEFGTDTGMGTVAMLEGLSEEARIFTVDIDPISTKNGAWLVPEDFASGRVHQIVSDMKSPQLFTKYARELAEAELLFVDGPKDGITEASFVDQLSTVAFHHPPIVVFDDIRLMNMLSTWRKLSRPKMDFTSFGHWSGTGLVDWIGL